MEEDMCLKITIKFENSYHRIEWHFRGKISNPLGTCKSKQFICNNCLTNCQDLQTQLKTHESSAPSKTKIFSSTQIHFYNTPHPPKNRKKTTTHDINTSPKTTTTDIRTTIQISLAVEEGGMQGFKDKVIEYIDGVHVSCCLQGLLLKKGKCTHDGLINTLKIIIRREVRCAEVCILQHWITLSFPMATCSERLYSRGTCVDRNVRKCKWNELACHKIAFACWNNVKKVSIKRRQLKQENMTML